MRANEHPPQFIAKVRKLWNAGLTTSEIGRRLGVSKNVIVGIAHRHDGFPQRRAPIPNPVDLLPRRRQIVAAWNEGRRYGYEIAEQSGVSRHVFYNDLSWARQNGWIVAALPQALKSDQAMRAAATVRSRMQVGQRGRQRSP